MKSKQGVTSKHFPIRLAYEIDTYAFTIGFTCQKMAIAIWLGFIGLRAWYNPKVGNKYIAEM